MAPSEYSTPERVCINLEFRYSWQGCLWPGCPGSWFNVIRYQPSVDNNVQDSLESVRIELEQAERAREQAERAREAAQRARAILDLQMADLRAEQAARTAALAESAARVDSLSATSGCADAPWAAGDPRGALLTAVVSRPAEVRAWVERCVEHDAAAMAVAVDAQRLAEGAAGGTDRAMSVAAAALAGWDAEHQVVVELRSELAKTVELLSRAREDAAAAQAELAAQKRLSAATLARLRATQAQLSAAQSQLVAAQSAAGRSVASDAATVSAASGSTRWSRVREGLGVLADAASVVSAVIDVGGVIARLLL
jgi:hypothetical protein